MRLLCKSCPTLTFLVATLLLPSVSASEPQPTALAHFKHSHWTVEEGGPSAVGGIAQTPDGYLWLATPEGLIRFDGRTFEDIGKDTNSPFRSIALQAVLVTREGELWAGYGQGRGVAVLRGGKLVDMNLPDPPSQVISMAEGLPGEIWVAFGGAGTRRLARWWQGRWTWADETFGLPREQILRVVGAPDQSLWVSINGANAERSMLAVQRPGNHKFQVAMDNLQWPYPAFDPVGKMWVADRKAIRPAASKPIAPGEATGRMEETYPTIAGARLLELRFDHWAGIWGTTRSVGLFRIDRPVRRVEYFQAKDGLTSDVTYQPLVDREGNVWIGTGGGLDMFRYTNVFPVTGIPADSINGLRMTRSSDGTVYVSSDLKIYRIRPGEEPRLLRPARNEVDTLCTIVNGEPWISETKGLHRLDPSGGETIPLPSDIAPDVCVGASSGKLWIGSSEGASWHDEKGWHRLAITANRPIFDMARGAENELAFNVERKAIALIEGDRARLIKAASLGLDDITTIASIDDGLLIAGSKGLVRYRHGRFSRIGVDRQPWMSRFRGIIQTPDGMIWALNSEGLSRFPAASLEAAFDNPSTMIDRRLFDISDGLASGPQHVGFRSQQLASTSDGRIWMLTRSGLFELDPKKIRTNNLAPPVVVQSLLAGGATYFDLAGLVLPPGTRSLQINFAALALTIPDRVAFRYRLEGVDDGWQSLTGKGMASYTNLGPGHYQFQVSAANEDGVWNTTGATLEFDIRPTFFQTWPFRLVCALALLGLLRIAYVARLHHATAGIRQRLAERLEERERIAREIHDTLLQSVQALTWQLQTAVDDLPPGEPVRDQLELAIARAEDAIVEGRDRVRELRSDDEESDLGSMVAEIIATQGFDASAQISMKITGAPKALDPIACEEILQVAREAIFNIRRHAGARQIEVELCYLGNFSIHIVDDGVGIPAEFLKRPGRKGHFGLSGMRERAATLRGQLAIRQGSSGGTALILTVPGHVAYKRDRSINLPFFRRRQ